jgi:hypothetical protein
MNRNAKIALGCGGAGCLGLIVVVIIVVVLIVTGIIPAPGLYNANRDSNYNSNSNSNDNSNANTNANDKESTDSSDSSSLSDDDKHKLFQAAGMTQDNALIMRVLKKIGFSDVGGEEYQQFVKDHGPWALRNMDFVRSVVTPEKAREYVEAHIGD